MDVSKLVAIDVHTHAKCSCRQAYDEEYARPYDEAAEKYFKFNYRPTIPETVAYRERNIGLVMFTVDTEVSTGRIRIQRIFEGANGSFPIEHCVL